MSGASIKVTGLDVARRSIKAIGEARLLPDICGTLLVAGVKRTFERGVDPDTGTKWPQIKNRKGRPLRDTGVLMRSIHYERRGRSIEVGTNLIYAATHQFGDPNRRPKTAKALVFKVMGKTVFARRVKIPQRKFLPETEAGQNRATDGKLRPVIEQYLLMQWA